jgi:hypothetical protein
VCLDSVKSCICNKGQFRKKVTLSHVQNEVTSEPIIMRYTAIVRKTLKSLFVIDAGKCFWPPPTGETVLQKGDTVSPGGGGPKHFPESLTNFESFPNNCCISRDCRLTGYFIKNMWKCYLLFELLCIKCSVRPICFWNLIIFVCTLLLRCLLHVDSVLCEVFLTVKPTEPVFVRRRFY